MEIQYVIESFRDFWRFFESLLRVLRDFWRFLESFGKL